MKSAYAAILAGVLALMLAGCSSNKAQPAPKATQQHAAAPVGPMKPGDTSTIPKQMAAIDSNTFMPPEAKAAAKAALLKGASVAQQESR